MVLYKTTKYWLPMNGLLKLIRKFRASLPLAISQVGPAVKMSEKPERLSFIIIIPDPTQPRREQMFVLYCLTWTFLWWLPIKHKKTNWCSQPCIIWSRAGLLVIYNQCVSCGKQQIIWEFVKTDDGSSWQTGIMPVTRHNVISSTVYKVPIFIPNKDL